MSDLRKERERVARRYAIGSVVFVALLFCCLLFWRIAWGCGHSLFGWNDGYRWCKLPEIWDWLLSGADWPLWAAILTAIVLILIKWRTDDGS